MAFCIAVMYAEPIIKINLNVLKPQDVSPTLSYDLDTCQDVWRANKQERQGSTT